VYDRVHPNDHVNLGQSTNDTYPSALRMALRMELDGLIRAVQACARAFAAKGREFAGVAKAGRTHLQDAVPVTLGMELGAYGASLLPCAGELRHAADGLLELGLGGSAAGTGMNVDRRATRLALRRMSKQTGHRWRQAANLAAAMQSQLPLSVASAAMRNLALELIRITNDLRLLASGPRAGLHELDLPALQPGSSIMPGKVNPVMPEMLAMVAFQAVGNDTATALAVQAGQLELNVMMPAMARATLESASILTCGLNVFTERCIAGLRAARGGCETSAYATLALAASLNPYIGYSRAAKLVQEALRTGRPLLEVARAAHVLPEAQLKQLLDPVAATGTRPKRSGRALPAVEAQTRGGRGCATACAQARRPAGTPG
ncbi:MAG: lyase family protein, partial [Terriglobales bacterium]